MTAGISHLSIARLLLLFFAFLAQARSAEVTTMTLCDLMKTPEKFAGQTVSLKARADRHIRRVVLFGEGCDELVLLELRSKVEPQRELPLERDKQFEKFSEALFDFKPGTLELRNRIEADFTGRFDWVFARGRNQNIGEGYRQRLHVTSRLVLYKVSNVSIVPK